MIRWRHNRQLPMISKLAFVHTSHVLIPTFAQLAREILPELAVFHMTDESLIRNTIEAGRLTPTTVRRLVAMVGSAHEGGADAVMVTCSSIGEGVTVAREMYEFPVLRIDEAMAEAAVDTGARIGVAATLSTTLDPTVRLIRATAAARGREVEVVPSLCAGAFEAVIAGDTARHDAMVSAALAGLLETVDVVVLAQASMARVVASLPPGSTPILASPELALRRARGILLA
jgi:Asp/Glu/hydantoin racemase